MKNLFINKPILAMVISIVIVVAGVIAVRGLPVEQYPDITPPTVLVRASYQGADAVTVDQSVATPVAQGVMGVEKMLYMKATSSNDGQMTMRVTFEVGSDPNMDQVFTQNNVASVQALLPEAVQRQGVTTRKSMSGFLLIFALCSDGRYGGDYLSNYAYLNIQNELLKLDGVGDVRILGAGQYSMRVWVKPDLLSYHNLSVADVAGAIEAQNGVYPAGQFGAEPAAPGTEFTYTVTMPPQIDTPEQYENIVLRTLPDGSQVLLGDVATVRLGSQNYGVQSSFGGHPSAAIAVYQTPGSNAMQVGDRIKEAMQQAAERFPDGMRYETVIDTTRSITAGIRDIFFTLGIALLLVIGIIYLFLQDLRATVIPLIAIPVSLLGAFAFFPLLGFSINIISLLGLVLAIGLVVDDAIVVVEAVQTGIDRGLEPRKATVEAMKAVRSPIIATTVVLIAVFLPVALTGGVTGKLYQQFAVTIAASVAVSTVNALTLSPALCGLLMRPVKKRTKGFFGAFNRLFDRGMKGYTSAASTLVRHAGRTLIFVGVAAAALAVCWKLLPSGFLPEEDQGYLMVAINLPDAASVQRTAEVAARVEKIVSSRPDVRFTSSTVGFNMISEVTSTHSGIIFVNLRDYADRHQTAARIAAQLNRELYGAVPEAMTPVFGPPPIPGLGITSGISLWVQDRGGNTPDYLARHTDAFIAQAQKLPSIASATSQFNTGVPQRRLKIDRDYALREGVSLDELHTALAAYLGGMYVNNFNRFGRLYQTYIQAGESYRQGPDGLASFFVRNGQGESVPLTAFVTVRDTTGVEYLSQLNLYRAASLTAAPAPGHSTTQGMADLQALADSTLPADMTIAWSDISYQEQQAAAGGWMAYLYALIFVFLALVALYNSWSLPASVLLGLPFALLGSVAFVLAAHLLAPHYVNNLFMQVSLVMLMGLSAKNGILIVEYANRLFFEEGQSLLKAAMKAATIRLRPIVMTAFAFILGVSPLIFASGAYSQARNVMGVALLGGMLIATVMGVFVYPSLYVLVGKLGKFEKKRAETPEAV